MKASRLFVTVVIFVACSSAFADQTWEHYGQCWAMFESARQSAKDNSSRNAFDKAKARAELIFIRVAADAGQVFDVSTEDKFAEYMRNNLIKFDRVNRAMSQVDRKKNVEECMREFY